MRLNFSLIILIALSVFAMSGITLAEPVRSQHEPKHFSKIMIVVFENMSYAEIKNEPIFKRLLEYTGSYVDANGKLVKLVKSGPSKDIVGNGYAFFSHYYNNHSGGTLPTRPSQPNYLAMTSGSIHGVYDNAEHNLDVDNLAEELMDANVSWKVYAEDLPRHKNRGSKQHAIAQHACFTGLSNPNDDGYQRKHEPFISYTNIQTHYNQCKRIVNSAELQDDLDHNSVPAVSFYIPNQIHDGHNGTLVERTTHANAFLSTMLGTDAKTGQFLSTRTTAPFQQFMAQEGLLVITFDEPSVTGNPDNTIYTLFAGTMINSGVYPEFGEYAAYCYPYMSEQARYPQDENGDYAPFKCNHYNLLKMIEANWSLRGLNAKHTSSGYKYAYPLDDAVTNLWKNESGI